MRPTLLMETLDVRAKAHFAGQRIRPALVQGPPGVGKTQMIQALARDAGVGFMSLHAPLMLNEDFGMPRFMDDGELSFATHGHKFPFVDTDCPDHGFFLVDEVAQADASQQKIWANIFQERELHGRKLKPGWYFAATGNRLADRAGANRILSHFNDRFTTYEFEANLDDWCTWALDHGVRPEVVAFLRFKPGLLSAHDPAMDKSPTPRAWTEGVSPVLDTVSPAALFDTVKGDVGEGAAAEFTAFLQTFRELPDPDMILSDPANFKVPTELHILYALAGAIAHRATPENFEAVSTFVQRMPPEFMILVVRDAIKINPAIENTKACVQLYVGAMKDVLLNQR